MYVIERRMCVKYSLQLLSDVVNHRRHHHYHVHEGLGGIPFP